MGHGDMTKCNKCGWVHFEVSLDYCKDWEKDWIAFWLSLSSEDRISYGVPKGPPTIDDCYLRCFNCNNSYKDFSKNNIPDLLGCTIQPILGGEYEYKKK